MTGSGSEAGSYLRLVDSCITLLKAKGPSRTCNDSKEEEEEGLAGTLTLGPVRASSVNFSDPDRASDVSFLVLRGLPVSVGLRCDRQGGGDDRGGEVAHVGF